MVTIADNYRKLVEEIAQEAIKAKRDPATVKLIVVSKTHPWELAEQAYNAGCRNFGENRVQDALEKVQESPEDVQWHLIGTLQKNKINKVIGKFALIHSVDSYELAEKISQVSIQNQLITPILLQVNVSGEESKHGFTSDSVKEQFEKLSALQGIKIEGLMTMAPLTDDKEITFRCFDNLRKLRDQLGLKELSMGMSNDWREAVQTGATLLRIGSAVFNPN